MIAVARLPSPEFGQRLDDEGRPCDARWTVDIEEERRETLSSGSENTCSSGSEFRFMTMRERRSPKMPSAFYVDMAFSARGIAF